MNLECYFEMYIVLLRDLIQTITLTARKVYLLKTFKKKIKNILVFHIITNLCIHLVFHIITNLCIHLVFHIITNHCIHLVFHIITNHCIHLVFHMIQHNSVYKLRILVGSAFG